MILFVPEAEASATQKSCNGLGSNANAMQQKLRATVLNKRACFAMAKALNLAVFLCGKFAVNLSDENDDDES